jgi:hypothetical protein
VLGDGCGAHAGGGTGAGAVVVVVAAGDLCDVRQSAVVLWLGPVEAESVHGRWSVW